MSTDSAYLLANSAQHFYLMAPHRSDHLFPSCSCQTLSGQTQELLDCFADLNYCSVNWDADSMEHCWSACLP